jgi:hypothetical protein
MRKNFLVMVLCVALVGFGVAGIAEAQTAQVPVKKGCVKGKGKKKGCKKKPAVCQAYAPGEKGASKPTAVVTDAHTEASPLVQKVNIAESFGDLDLTGLLGLEGTADAFNVQVDSAAADAGLHVLFEFPERRDYDLEMWWADGSYAARSHDFNTMYSPTPETYANGGHAGVATDASEHIVGVRTPDCGGYTVETVNWLGEGGEFEIKLWLGEIVNDPQPQGAEVPE